ncbi:MAG: radical SAM protein [Bdellovibrionales bacterium]|nr:radical SAM protein [Bdellovibrionales bacterium]
MAEAFWSEYDFTKIPFSSVSKTGQRSLLYRDLFTVSWLLGRYCNYKCSYCWPYARSDVRDHRPKELVIQTINEIKRQARQRGFNSFHFSFSGGEPTLHPGYLEFLKHYADDTVNTNYQSLHMTTNMSAGVAFLEKYAEVTRPLHRVSVTASYHKEFADKNKFTEKLIFLQEHEIQVTINMVMVPERFDVLWEEALEFHHQGINVTLKPQSNTSATAVVSGYSEDMLVKLQRGMPQRDYTRARLQSQRRESQRPVAAVEALTPHALNSDSPEFPTATMQVELEDTQGNKWYMDQAERFNSFGFNNFKGWVCSAGYRSIIIREPDGMIKRSYSCNDLPLGNIETGFELFPSPQLCTTSSCVSSADSKIPKRKKDYPSPLWKGDQTY